MIKTPNKQTFWIFTTIGVALLLSIFSILLKKDTKKTEKTVVTRLVETVIAKKRPYTIKVSAFGTVQAEKEVTLKSEVSGRVIEQAESLVVGGLTKTGEVLLKLDPRDYFNRVEQEKSAVEKARFELELEKGRQLIAKREWEQLSGTIKKAEISEDLALRKPHLREKEAALQAAISRYEQAKLDLERTVIYAPMDGVIVSETVEKGDYVTSQDTIAQMAATNAFRVQVSLPIQKLQWLKIPGTPVTIIQDLGSKQVRREGEILRLLGDLDTTGRMARVLVSVKDPLNLKKSEEDSPPLLIGSYVEVEFEGPEISDAIVLPRNALREGTYVWIKNAQNLLEIRDVAILYKREECIFLNGGIKEGEEIVLSQLPLAIPGIPLRTLKNKENKENGECLP